MKWITNCHESDVDKYKSEPMAGWNNRKIVTSGPKETYRYSVLELQNLGMVGLYDLKEV